MIDKLSFIEFCTVYFVGVILCYILARYVDRKEAARKNLPYYWCHILMNICFSLFSWFGLFAIGVGSIFDYLWRTKRKPPKWL